MRGNERNERDTKREKRANKELEMAGERRTMNEETGKDREERERIQRVIRETRQEIEQVWGGRKKLGGEGDKE